MNSGLIWDMLLQPGQIAHINNSNNNNDNNNNNNNNNSNNNNVNQALWDVQNLWNVPEGEESLDLQICKFTVE